MSYDKVTGSDRNELLESFYEMVIGTYAKIGIPIKNKNELLELTEWHVYPNSETPMAIAGFKKTPFGLKYTIVGSDGSREGKSFVRDSINTLNSKGFYGELSHRLQDIAEDIGIPKVPAEFVGDILNKEIQPLDEFRYERKITNVGLVQKTMFGLPNKVVISGFTRISEKLIDVTSNWDAVMHRTCMSIN